MSLTCHAVGALKGRLKGTTNTTAITTVKTHGGEVQVPVPAFLFTHSGIDSRIMFADAKKAHVEDYDEDARNDDDK